LQTIKGKKRLLGWRTFTCEGLQDASQFDVATGRGGFNRTSFIQGACAFLTCNGKKIKEHEKECFGSY
ncbi:hypothetical protein D7Z54_26525, partial [Salibacterium salarium]